MSVSLALPLTVTPSTSRTASARLWIERRRRSSPSMIVMDAGASSCFWL
ncbi:hypothetical protein P0F65_21045 [Sphingomonas sp. I4]